MEKSWNFVFEFLWEPCINYKLFKIYKGESDIIDKKSYLENSM